MQPVQLFCAAMLQLLFLLVGAVVLVYAYIARKRSYWRDNGVPSHTSNWILGVYKESFSRHYCLVFDDIYKSFPEARYCGYMKVTTPALLLRDPALVRAVLTTDFHYFAENDVHVDPSLDPLVASNPFFVSGEEWKRSRGHITPTTTATKLRVYFPVIRRVASNLASYVRSQRDERGVAELETRDLVGKFTTDVIANAVFGVENDEFTSSGSVFSYVTRNIFNSTLLGMIKSFALFTMPTLQTVLRTKFIDKKSEEMVMELTRRILKHREETGEARNDFFQQMITLRQNDKSGSITDAYIASHCFEFIADGYETSSNVISFTFFELAWHDDVQKRLREEILEMIKETKDDYQPDDIAKLKYLDMVLSESMRLHPAAPALLKRCSQPYTLPAPMDGGSAVNIAKGTPVTIPVYSLHRDPKYWPNPNKFDPERFNDENTATRDKFVHIPFGEGPRICLGMRFALLQVKMALVSVLSRYELRPSPRAPYPAAYDPRVPVLRPPHGLYLLFTALQ